MQRKKCTLFGKIKITRQVKRKILNSYLLVIKEAKLTKNGFLFLGFFQDIQTTCLSFIGTLLPFFLAKRNYNNWMPIQVYNNLSNK